MNTLTLSGAVFIGLSLGLTGAGGSIITLPVLVYLAGLLVKEAGGISLFVVGSAALVGAVQRARAGDFHFPASCQTTKKRLSFLSRSQGGRPSWPHIEGGTPSHLDWI
ncbi:sulfite exporter TauE/SafE family protein [Prosthecobacter sp. SYSU 5D2]|uniref:sulfite exporter TauE/SafE family protein n=1 Tax=Prosthecobacter sp. SYSU 5D2 TaxID=3134134 RepID=UPI0031FEDD28